MTSQDKVIATRQPQRRRSSSSSSVLVALLVVVVVMAASRLAISVGCGNKYVFFVYYIMIDPLSNQISKTHCEKLKIIKKILKSIFTK